jgi:large subunit ribosomal protein L19
MAATKLKHRKTNKGLQKPISGLAARVALVDKTQAKTTLPKFKAGDTVQVHVRIKEGDKERTQIFEGVCIARGNRGGSKSFTVRKSSHGVGVERIFLDNSPKVARLDVVQEGRVRRAKLYYLRGLSGKAARIDRETETASQGATS